MDHKNIITYLEKNVKNFKINRRLTPAMFTCPNCDAHETARFIPGTSKINCMKCGYSDDIVGIGRLLGTVDHTKSDEAIKDALCIDLNVENTRITKEILDFYEESKFDLTPLQKNSKRPFELDWVNNKHTQRFDWEQILNSGQNIGVKTGSRSGITIIDVDQAEIPADIDLLKGDSLIQKTGRGWHLFYKFTPELPTTKIDEYKIDILNDGKQAVIYPSIIVNEETKMVEPRREYVTPLVINEMPADLLKLLKSKINPITVEEQSPVEFKVDENAELNFIDSGGRNNALMQLGGILNKELNSTHTEYVLTIMNKKLCNPPLNNMEFRNVLKMLAKYSKRDDKDLANQIFKYLNIVEFANSKEIKDALGFPKEDIDKALAFLVKELKLIKRGRNFSIVKRGDWKTTLNSTANMLDFDMPYFSKFANLCWGDNVLLGSATKNGKTTIAMNIIRYISDQLKASGSTRKIHYITSEAGSRFMKTAAAVGLLEGDFVWDFISDPTKINLEDDAITILDWLMIEDKAQTDSVMKYFVDQLWKSKGFLVTFMQLKEGGTNDWFAPNMVKQFPALASRYVYTDNGAGIKGQWILDAIRDPKGHYKTGIIPCTYNFQSKTLVEDIQ